jgi:hypothetical protein
MELILFSYFTVITIITTDISLGNETASEVPCPPLSHDCEKVQVRENKLLT